MLVIPAYQLDVLVVYGQLWRSLGYRGGAKNTPKNTQKQLKRL